MTKDKNFKGNTMSEMLDYEHMATHRTPAEINGVKHTGVTIECMTTFAANGKGMVALHLMDNGCWYSLLEDYYYVELENKTVAELPVGTFVDLEENFFDTLTVVSVTKQ